MFNSNTKDRIFAKKHGRLAFFNKCWLWWLNKQLDKRARKNIAEHRKQLIVFSFDHITQYITLDGVYEKDDLDTFFAWATAAGLDFKDATAVDIGANIGNHSLYFSDYFKRVVSFEPNPRTFKVLSLNAELANNVSCYNVGLSDEAGTATLSVNPSNIGSASISESNASNAQNIELIALDSFEKLDHVKLLKIDVEGHEYKALSGARNLIKEQAPIILFEQHINDFKDGESPVVSLLKELGYEDFAIVRKYPRVSGSFVTKALFVPLLRAVFGESTAIVRTKTIKPDFYNFIIALPYWVTKNIASN